MATAKKSPSKTAIPEEPRDEEVDDRDLDEFDPPPKRKVGRPPKQEGRMTREMSDQVALLPLTFAAQHFSYPDTPLIFSRDQVRSIQDAAWQVLKVWVVSPAWALIGAYGAVIFEAAADAERRHLVAQAKARGMAPQGPPSPAATPTPNGTPAPGPEGAPVPSGPPS